MALLALIVTVASALVGAAAVWTGLNASKAVPWDMQTWKGQSPEEQDFKEARRRDTAWTRGLGMSGAVGVIIGALLAYFSR